MVSLRLKTAVRVLRLWQRIEDYVLFVPGGVWLTLPQCWIGVDMYRCGDLTIEVSEPCTNPWPKTFWEAQFTPTSMKIGGWHCPQSLRAWRYQFKEWMGLNQ